MGSDLEVTGRKGGSKMLGMVGAGSVCCILCNGSILFFDKVGKVKFQQHMQFEHGAMHNLDFMLAACKMNDTERQALVDVFDPDKKSASPAQPNNIENTGAKAPSAEEKDSIKVTPQTPRKRNSPSATANKNKEPKTPRKRDVSAPPETSAKKEPKTPKERDASAPPLTPSKEKGKDAQQSKTPKKKNPVDSNDVSASLKKTPKTPKKVKSSASPIINEPSTPMKKDLLSKSPMETPKKQDLMKSKVEMGELRTPLKKGTKTPKKLENLYSAE